MLTTQDVLDAATRIDRYARRTPLLRTTVDGRPVVLKLEHLQLTGAFKLRGALNALLSEANPPERVVTASGGNHGFAVATTAALLGLPATVFVPTTVPAGKARRIEAAGAKLIRHGDRYAEAAAAALELAAEPGSFYVPAYDHPAVVAGQGTVAAEVLADIPAVDAFYAAAGGGGLAAGTALAAGQDRLTLVCEPHGCASVHNALAAGHPVDSEVDSVAASALGASRAGAIPLAVLQAHPTRSVLVSDAQLLAARDRLWEEFRLAVEPAAAVPFAAWLAEPVGELPCVILSGANTDWTPSA